MTDSDYRALPRWANSDLSALAVHLFNRKPIKASADTLAFGTAFHTLLLEPGRDHEAFAMLKDEAQFQTMYAMWKAVLAFDEQLGYRPLLEQLCQSEKEQVRTWTDPAIGLPCKAKIDAVALPKRQHIIDLKTTSCKSKSDFLTTCHDYDYDRQAAHYLSSDPNAKFFEFVGVQKQPPYQVFRLSYHRSDEFIRGGFVKRDKLLKLAAEQVRSGGWVPTSWKTDNQIVI